MPKTKAKSEPLTANEKVLKIFTKPTGEVQVKLTDNNPRTVGGIIAALPFESQAQIWGDEVYFKIPVKVPEENTKTVVEVGDIAYWPPGESMCIFFGPTPASKVSEPRAYSPVNVFGKIIGDALVFKRVRNGEKIKVEGK